MRNEAYVKYEQDGTASVEIVNALGTSKFINLGFFAMLHIIAKHEAVVMRVTAFVSVTASRGVV